MSEQEEQVCPVPRFCLGMYDWTGCVNTSEKLHPNSQSTTNGSSSSPSHVQNALSL